MKEVKEKNLKELEECKKIKEHFISSFEKHFGNKPALSFAVDLSKVKQVYRLLEMPKILKLVDDFMVSRKAKECGHTMSVCFSAHTINTWQAGQLLPMKQEQKFKKYGDN